MRSLSITYWFRTHRVSSTSLGLYLCQSRSVIAQWIHGIIDNCNVTDTKESRTYSTALSSTTVLMANGQSIDVNIHLDTCGSRNLASEHLLHNIKRAEEYGHNQIYMVTVNGNSPSYNRMGELHFIDEDKNPIITLCYVQAQPIKGIDNFVLISNSTLVAIQTDLNYHSSMCEHVGILPLRRLASQPYHYSDKVKHFWLNDSDTILHIKESDKVAKKQSIPVHDGKEAMLTVEETETNTEGDEAPDTCQCACQPRLAEQLHEVDFLKITGRRLRKSRKNRNNPKKDKNRLKVSRHTCFMSEVQLQGLLDRTKPSQGDEEAMDMTTIDGIRVSKYSIKAIKIGNKVNAQMRKEFEQFNSEHVGEDSVFPTKNGAPKILEQFKDKPYTLELRDEFTMGNKC